jgi:hypothetical protein
MTHGRRTLTADFGCRCLYVVAVEGSKNDSGLVSLFEVSPCLNLGKSGWGCHEALAFLPALGIERTAWTCRYGHRPVSADSKGRH